MCARLSDVVADAQVRELAGGFQFTEGPLWHPDGYLIFSDIPADTIYQLNPNGSVETFLTPTGNSNGLTFDRRGNLLVCEHSGRRVSMMEAGHRDSPRSTVADQYQGKRLNSPNDVVCHSSGRIYFTDPPFGIDPDPGEIGFNGVYRVNLDRSVDLISNDFTRPNGLAFSPDETLLYVNDCRPPRRRIHMWDADPEGNVSNDRVFIDMETEGEGSPDGMKVDTQGNVYCTGPGSGIWVMDPDGNRLGTIPVPQLPANVAFGGPDLKTLYITARTGIYSIGLKVAGTTVFEGQV